MILTNKEKELISKEIENLEKLTSAELITVITQKSSNYKSVMLMFSIVSVFLISFLLFFIKDDLYVLELIQYQIVIFIGMNLFFQTFHNLFMKLLPRFYKDKIASLYAKKQFYNLGLNRTKTKQAIMFFVSLDEKYVEIITDSEISKKIPNEFWHQVISEFTYDIKNEDFLTGYLKALKASKAILIQHFPILKNDINELPNEVIELK